MSKSARRPRTRKPASGFPADLTAGLKAALDKKALDVVVLDLRAGAAFTDFFVVCTGTNVRQTQAIADAIQQALAKRGARPALVEGFDRGEWILIDYFDAIFHVFLPATRAFYALERLWGDATRTEIPG